MNQMQSIVKARRDSLKNSHQIGLEYLKTGEYEKAAAIFREAIVSNPHFCFSYHYLGECLFRLGQYPEAEESFAKAFDLNPYFAPTLAFRGDLTLIKGDLIEAENLYRRAIEINPKLFQAYKGLLKISYQSADTKVNNKLTEDENFSPAIELALENRQWIIELLDAAFPDPDFYLALGNSLETHDQKDSAVVCYQLALLLNPQRAEIWLNIARIYFDLDENEYAAECQSEAAALKSDSVEIHSLLGEIWCKRKRYPEAIAAYQKAAQLEPENAKLNKIIGDLQARQGLINEARVSYNRAIELGYEIY